MNRLNILQSNGIETVGNSSNTIGVRTVEKLYLEAKDGLDNELEVELEGSILVDKAYRDSVEWLLLNTGLNITVADSYYIRFTDSETARVLTLQYGDGMGITESLALSMTIIADRLFEENNQIVSFNELYKFGGGAGIRIGINTFADCTNLQTIDLRNVSHIDASAFKGCSNLAIDVNAPKLTRIDNRAFQDSGITSISNLGSITTLDAWSGYNHGIFARCRSLVSVTLPNTLTTIQADSFNSCQAIQHFDGTSSVTLLGDFCFNAFHTTGILHFENVDTLNGACQFRYCHNKLIYLGKITVTHNLSGWAAIPNYRSGLCSGMKSKMIYLRDILVLHAGDFNECDTDSIVINNTTIPTVNAYGDKSPSDSDYNASEHDPSILFKNSTIGAIYVPDGYESAYQNHSIFGTQTIKPISELSKVATKALWDQLTDALKDITLIEEYM